MKSFYHLDLDLYPFNRSLDEIMSGVWGENVMSRTHSIDDLNPKLINFFKSNNVDFADTWILIHWWDDKEAQIHTDGNWFSDDLMKKRRCGINWNFTPGTWVEFYDSTTLTPYKRPQDLTNTFWLGTPNIIDKWNTSGPVLLNPQIPHAVRKNHDAGRRISCTLKFFETFESIVSKLQKYLKYESVLH